MWYLYVFLCNKSCVVIVRFFKEVMKNESKIKSR